MRIGLIAPEFLGYGGMAEFGRQLACGLAATDDVIVWTRRDAAGPGPPADAPIDVRPELERELVADLDTLAREPRDVWFAANAGYVPLAAELDEPLVVYVNGNDLLKPWIRRDRPWLRRLETSTTVWRVVSRLRERMRKSDLRGGLRAAARVVANSRRTAEIVEARYPGNNERTTIVHPGVSDDYFRERGPRRDGPLRILTVTRLDLGTPRKNVDGVLRALSLLPPGTDVVYTVVGDGEERARLEALAAELGVAGITRFVGFVDREELADIYADSDLFILASRASANDVEGFGIVYLEASATGTPVICSRAGGAVDAVEEGANGVVIADSEPPTIADAIRAFAARPDRFDAERVRAVADRHRWGNVTERIRAILCDVVEDARNR
ncbi:MAG TPA: glycosyltransferase family 4 protein [Longimicrobiales bacterium]|nr:glycosyltransferase family 4 protein [Longimicrobiales bacterium]